MNPLGKACRNVIISGMVGTWKSMFVRESILQGKGQFCHLVLDVHHEYGSAFIYPKLDRRLVTQEFLDKLFGSSPAYHIDMVACLREGGGGYKNI